jgi:hypothetical protein
MLAILVWGLQCFSLWHMVMPTWGYRDDIDGHFIRLASWSAGSFFLVSVAAHFNRQWRAWLSTPAAGWHAMVALCFPWLTWASVQHIGYIPAGVGVMLQYLILVWSVTGTFLQGDLPPEIRDDEGLSHSGTQGPVGVFGQPGLVVWFGGVVEDQGEDEVDSLDNERAARRTTRQRASDTDP